MIEVGTFGYKIYLIVWFNIINFKYSFMYNCHSIGTNL